MCAHCNFTGNTEDHIDGTVLDANMKPLFAGSLGAITEWIIENPLLVYSVWVAGEGESISIDEWMEWMDEIDR